MHGQGRSEDNAAVSVGRGLNRAELRRYITRVSDRWQIEAAYLGGARVADEHGAPAQRERGPEFVVVLVSAAFDQVPWLERVYVAGSLWDGLEMGSVADVHCYTPRVPSQADSAVAGPRCGLAWRRPARGNPETATRNLT